MSSLKRFRKDEIIPPLGYYSNSHTAFCQLLFDTLTVKHPYAGFGTFYPPYRQLPLRLKWEPCVVVYATTAGRNPAFKRGTFNTAYLVSNALQII